MQYRVSLVASPNVSKATSSPSRATASWHDGSQPLSTSARARSSSSRMVLTRGEIRLRPSGEGEADETALGRFGAGAAGRVRARCAAACSSSAKASGTAPRHRRPRLRRRRPQPAASSVAGAGDVGRVQPSAPVGAVLAVVHVPGQDPHLPAVRPAGVQGHEARCRSCSTSTASAPNAVQQMLYGNFKPEADQNDFLIVAPDGQGVGGGRHFNLTRREGPAERHRHGAVAAEPHRSDACASTRHASTRPACPTAAR